MEYLSPVRARLSHLHRISVLRWGWAAVGGAWTVFQWVDFSINKWCSTEHKTIWNTYTLHVPFSWHTWAIGILVFLVLFILEGSYQDSQRLEAVNTSLSKESSEQALDPSSPQLTVSVIDMDFRGLPQTGIIVTNVGGTAMQKLQLCDMVVSGHRVVFDSNIPILDAHQPTHPIKVRIDGLEGFETFYLPYAMIKDWDTQATRPFKDKLLFPCTATYEDANQNMFQAFWDFEFYPRKYRRHQQQNLKNLRRMIIGPLPDTPKDPYLVVPSVRAKMVKPRISKVTTK